MARNTASKVVTGSHLSHHDQKSKYGLRQRLRPIARSVNRFWPQCGPALPRRLPAYRPALCTQEAARRKRLRSRPRLRISRAFVGPLEVVTRSSVPREIVRRSSFYRTARAASDLGLWEFAVTDSSNQAQFRCTISIGIRPWQCGGGYRFESKLGAIQSIYIRRQYD